MINATIVTMVGNVAGELRQRRTPEGAKVVSFRMAANERKYDPSSDRWVNGKHVYANVTCWRQLASGVAASLAKGDPVVVTGRLSTHEYEIDGQQRQSTEVDAIAVGPDLTRCTADIQRHRPDPEAGREGASRLGADAGEEGAVATGSAFGGDGTDMPGSRADSPEPATVAGSARAARTVRAGGPAVARDSTGAATPLPEAVA